MSPRACTRRVHSTEADDDASDRWSPGIHGGRTWAKAIEEKLDHLDEAFFFGRSLDIETYDRRAEKLREELTLARIDRQEDTDTLGHLLAVSIGAPRFPSVPASFAVTLLASAEHLVTCKWVLCRSAGS